MIYVIDYGAGNLYSAFYALKQNAQKIGMEVEIISRPGQMKTPVGVVLPGDGAFPAAWENLKKTGFVDYLKKDLEVPLLGICVGFQLLFSGSQEDGGAPGLDLIQGTIKRFSAEQLKIPHNLKIPHMGWNLGLRQGDGPLDHDLPQSAYYYFVHSYRPETTEPGVATMVTEYGGSFVSGLSKGLIHGYQFHPEKSHQYGRQIIKNFVHLCKNHAD